MRWIFGIGSAAIAKVPNVGNDGFIFSSKIFERNDTLVAKFFFVFSK